MSGTPLKYRADIDGLRAIAVIAVVLFHIDPNWLGGGYVGVDVFFVISGFLITSIIGREVAAGTFSFLRFYERRIRRIIPALFAVLLVVWIVGTVLLLPHDLMELGKSLRYTLASISNLHFLKSTEDYFHAGVDRMPLLHTWSLAVEEQFYIFFPIILILAHRWLKSRRAMLVLLVVIGIISLGASQWVVTHNQARAFYLLPWRAWELLLGSLLALAPHWSRKPVVDQLSGLAGLGAIAWSMVTYTHHTVFPGFSAFLGAALIIDSGRNSRSFVSKALGWKPVVFVGLISYSVYLWHWPLVVFLKYTFLYNDGIKLAILPGSLLLGFLSWQFVEKPFRSSGFLTRRKIYAAWAVGSLAFLGICIAIKSSEGFPKRFPPSVLKFLSAENIPEEFRTNARETFDAKLAPVFGDKSRPPTIALWGDSHAGALVPLMDHLGRKYHKAVLSFDMPSQPPILEVIGARHSDREKRAGYLDSVVNRLTGTPEIETVILHCRWTFYTRGEHQAAHEPPPGIYRHPFHTVEDQEQFILERFNETMELLLKAGKKIVLIHPIPELSNNVPDLIAKFAAVGKLPPDESEAYEYHHYNQATIRMLDAWAGHPGVTVVHPDRKLLNHGKVKIRDGDKLLYRDDDHLSVDGALYISDLLNSAFAPASASNPD
jgi:peptidoglycan/LPS O-acetylase OafA/YrhL